MLKGIPIRCIEEYVDVDEESREEEGREAIEGILMPIVVPDHYLL